MALGVDRFKQEIEQLCYRRVTSKKRGASPGGGSFSPDPDYLLELNLRLEEYGIDS